MLFLVIKFLRLQNKIKKFCGDHVKIGISNGIDKLKRLKKNSTNQTSQIYNGDKIFQYFDYTKLSFTETNESVRKMKKKKK